MKYKSLLSIIMSVALFFSANLAYSADNGNIDVVLVMDSSGSMKKTDPQSLRIPAAKLFISLLKEGDRAGVISFSGEQDTLINLTPVDSKDNEEKLFGAAEKITSRGRYTNLHGALTKGMEILAEDFSEGRTQIIILMSDGMMDVGNMIEDNRLVESIRTELSVTLEDSGIKVYTIAFTENSDRVLLERISKRTGGFYNLTLSDQDFHVVFTSIFESLKSPEMLPMSKNGFKVDSSVEEVTIVATKGSSDTKIMLNAPDSQSYTSDNKTDGIEWFPSNKFDMITVKNPSEGRWDILFSTGENNKAYIITDLKLKTNSEKLYSKYGEPRDVQVWLEKEGKILNEKDVLDKIEFIMELTDPDGRTTKLKPFNKGDGTYVRSIAPFSSGNYKLKVIARGMTFERTKEFVFNVADIKESKEDVKHDRVKKKQQEELLKKEQEEQAAKAQADLETSMQEEKTEEVSWVKVIIYFIAINLVLALGILAFIKIRKSKKTSPPKLKTKTEGDDEDAEQAQDEDKGSAVAAPELEAEPATNDDIKEKAVPETAPEESLSTEASGEQGNEQETEAQPSEEPVAANDQEIALDDVDMESAETSAGTEPAQEDTEPADDKKEMSTEKELPAQAAENVPDISSGTEEEQVDPDSVMSQDDLDALLATAPAREPSPEEVVEESTDTPTIKEEVDIQDILSDAIQDVDEVEQDAEGDALKNQPAEIQEVAAEDSNSQESIDDMWAEAFKEAEGDTEPEQKAEPEAPEQKSPKATAVASEEVAAEDSNSQENIDDMWAEAFKEAEGDTEPEQKAETIAPEEKAPEAIAGALDEEESEEAKDEENIDDMWAEAFKEAEGAKDPEQKADAPGEKRPEAKADASEEKSEQSDANSAEKKADIINSKKTTGEEPIDN